MLQTKNANFLNTIYSMYKNCTHYVLFRIIKAIKIEWKRKTILKKKLHLYANRPLIFTKNSSLKVVQITKGIEIPQSN